MANDMSIAYGIILFFFLVGAITPFMNASFTDLDIPENQPTGIIGDIDEDDLTSTKAYKVIKSLFKIFFWSFGALPTWIEWIIFIPLRILLVLIIARNIWIGGGG